MRKTIQVFGNSEEMRTILIDVLNSTDTDYYIAILTESNFSGGHFADAEQLTEEYAINFRKQIDALNNRMFFISGAFDITDPDNCPTTNEFYDRWFQKHVFTEVHCWPWYFVTACIATATNVRPIDPNELTVLFSSMNRIPHGHRVALVDLIAKHNLLESNDVTFVLPNDRGGSAWLNTLAVEFKHWEDPAILKFASEPDIQDVTNLRTLPVEYWRSLVDVIAETNDYSYFYTEKTAKAIWCLKPFLIVGCANVNTRLTEWGFEIYDELFDYSFDSIADRDERYEASIVELKKLEGRNLQELYYTVKAKAIRNLQNLMKLMLNTHTEYEKTYSQYLKQPEDVTVGINTFLKEVQCETINDIIGFDGVDINNGKKR
tara:strand:- start:10454 stop:11578 length:1125 start_codon:yes stop_codon:yes gene_type:complete